MKELQDLLRQTGGRTHLKLKLGDYINTLMECSDGTSHNAASNKAGDPRSITMLHPEMVELTVGTILDIALPTSPSSMLS